MFQSAVIKLTSWYLCSIMLISLMFSAAIYHITVGELEHRLASFRSRLETENLPATTSFEALQAAQAKEVRGNMVASLIYANIVVLVAGGISSYALARRALQPIEEAHERERRFVSDASHELRTPLTAIKTEIEVVLRDPSVTKAELREILESNLEEVNNLHALSDTLLSLSRGKPDALTFAKTALVPLVKKRADRYKRSGRSIVVAEPKTAIFVRAHTPSLDELFGILLDNALKYSAPDSTINVSLASSGDTATVTVRNTGPGIEPHDLPHIFERFYQADNARASGGHGLGLALAQRIVELHRGGISASSTPDEWTEFTVSLPLYVK